MSAAIAAPFPAPTEWHSFPAKNGPVEIEFHRWALVLVGNCSFRCRYCFVFVLAEYVAVAVVWYHSFSCFWVCFHDVACAATRPRPVRARTAIGTRPRSHAVRDQSKQRSLFYYGSSSSLVVARVVDSSLAQPLPRPIVAAPRNDSIGPRRAVPHGAPGRVPPQDAAVSFSFGTIWACYYCSVCDGSLRPC